MIFEILVIKNVILLFMLNKLHATASGIYLNTFNDFHLNSIKSGTM